MTVTALDHQSFSPKGFVHDTIPTRRSLIGHVVSRIDGDVQNIIGKPGCFPAPIFDESLLGQVIRLHSPLGTMSRFYEE